MNKRKKSPPQSLPQMPVKRAKTQKSSKQKTDNHALVNDLSDAEIKDIILLIYTSCYSPKTKGKQRANSLDYPVPYIIQYGSHYWANPWAFSWTGKTPGTGYPTLPYKASAELILKYSPASTTKKSTWIARVPIHLVIWRYFNGYIKIPIDKDISHLYDKPMILTHTTLLAEDGVYNRSRAACYKYAWYKTLRPNCKICVLCPHIPPCAEPPERPPDEAFTTRDNKPPSIPT